MKISVVIPCYNTEKFVVEAVESVFNQTFKDFEVIVVDDASTDKSPEIVKKLNVRYVRNEENLGIGGARARGVKEAKGEFLCFLSADDLFMPNYLEEMLKHTVPYHGTTIPPRIANKESFLFSDYYVINEGGAVTNQFRAPVFENYENLVVHSVVQAKNNNMFICYNLFGPTKLFRENNFDPSFRYGEDLEHLLRCMLVKKIEFRHVPLPLFKYRAHPKMVTQQKLKEIAGNNQKIFQKVNESLGRKVF